MEVGFSEVDARVNIIWFILSIMTGAGLVVGSLTIKVLLGMFI